MRYNLNSIPTVLDIVIGNNVNVCDNYLNVHDYHVDNIDYTIVKYNKDMLSSDIINTYGLLKSLIVSNGKVVSFAPPKSLASDTFMSKYPSTNVNDNNNIVVEEFVEGTMINLFYHKEYSMWQIATRNTVGANMSFYVNSHVTFKQMFDEACIYNNLQLEYLDTNLVYSFVLQHPENRIVVPFKNPQLYLVAVFEINQQRDDITIEEKDMSNVMLEDKWKQTSVKFPYRSKFTSYSELINVFASSNTDYTIMGIMIKNLETGEKTKFRNPNYEEVRQLRGNQSKLQYQYLCLRQSGKLSEYLKYYPETKNEMSKFRDQLHMFTNNLHRNYVSCYVNKEQKLCYFSDKYKTHMYKLHQHYIDNLRPKKLCITNTEVIKYVNSLHPSLLMYCLNYNLRRKSIDTVKANMRM